MKTQTAQTKGWAGGAPVARALSVLAVAGALFGGMARPAAADGAAVSQLLSAPLTATFTQAPDTAHDPTVPLRMDFLKLYCVEESDPAGPAAWMNSKSFFTNSPFSKL